MKFKLTAHRLDPENRNTVIWNKNYRNTAPKITQYRNTANPYAPLRQHSYFGVTHCENLEVQIAVFSKWNMLREWKLVQKFYFFVYLQPSVNKNP